MASSGIWCCVGLVRTGVLEEHIASIIKVGRIRMPGTTSAITSNWSTLWRNTRSNTVFFPSVFQLVDTINVVPSSLILSILMIKDICSSEMSVLTWATSCHIPEDGILHRLHLSQKTELFRRRYVTCTHTPTQTHTWYPQNNFSVFKMTEKL
jgi:hypothetical protein